MIEIERKFLVSAEKWNPSKKGSILKQGYLAVDHERTVRIRVSEQSAFLTIKGKTVGIKRDEFEYEIPKNEGEELLKMCVNHIVEKTRYKEKIGDLVWEIDVFEGVNNGLILAEVELKDENQGVQIPEWVEKEVSDDSRFYNSHLSSKPFTTW